MAKSGGSISATPTKLGQYSTGVDSVYRRCCQKGQRAPAALRYLGDQARRDCNDHAGHCATTASLRPASFGGPINGASFRAYVEQFLVPALRSGGVVVMDNLGSHKGKAVRRLIRAAGAKLFFLPRYSPDLNPIEQVFAKLKPLLRKTDPRTIDTIWRGIGDLLAASPLGNAPITSPMPGMLQPNRITL
jgi:transposase